MLDTPAKALGAMTVMTAISQSMQTLELWSLRKCARDDGVWSLARIVGDLSVFPRPVARMLEGALSYRGFTTLLWVRALSCIGLLVSPHLAFACSLLLSSLLIALRWRGSFNGGSDFMSLVVLSALSLAWALPSEPMATLAALWYVAIQACNSYFLAGVVKARSPSWRRGHALPAFLHFAIYDNHRLEGVLRTHPGLSLFACWTVIVLECAFPMALLQRELCWVFVGLAFSFHLGNVYVFGLNRFLWAWASTYPALVYCSGLLL